MKRILIITLIVMILFGGVLATQASAADKIVLPDNGLMLVIYEKSSNNYIMSIRGPASFVEEYSSLYIIINQWWKKRITNLVVNDYLVCPYQEIALKLEYNAVIDDYMPVPQTMAELGLIELDAENLPHSQHIAKLVDVNPAAKKPATVARKYLGNIYYESCLVSMPAKEAYQAGTLQIGDYVVIAYIDEIPDDNEINVCVLEYGIWESW